HPPPSTSASDDAPAPRRDRPLTASQGPGGPPVLPRTALRRSQRLLRPSPGTLAGGATRGSRAARVAPGSVDGPESRRAGPRAHGGGPSRGTSLLRSA